MRSVLTTKENLRNILSLRIKNDKYTLLKDLPDFKNFKDINKATQRVVNAIKNNENITIVGDYDVDGVVSTTIMVDFFKKIGLDVDWIVPNRFKHGYGLSTKIVEKINNSLIITVDNGINAINAAKLCKEKQCDLIITDHHTVGKEIPDAYAIINPKQENCNFEYKEICGAQVAWYFCASIKSSLNLKINLVDFFDLLCIAIIADVMPMRSLNAAIVKRGLKLFTKSKRPSMIVLTNLLKKSSINEEDIGYMVAPLINSSGRMKDASISVEFLLSNDTKLASEKLKYLIYLNNERKKEQNIIFQESLEYVKKDDDVIVVKSDKWNEGIIGIVASQLSDKFDKPSFVFSVKGEILKASARSNTNINLFDLIQSISHITIGFGGHKNAAGVVIHTSFYDDFKKQINKAVRLLKHDKIIKNAKYYELNINDIDMELYKLIEDFRPYGLENETPLFVFKNLIISNCTFIGKSKEHQKIIFENDLELLLFKNSISLKQGECISFTANILLNEFRGNSKLNLVLRNIINKQ